jgi:TolB-like protein/DNA-binding winged helix-turn-helix (wHTH) protein/Flp pilus assembly protein TadD
MHRAPAPRDAGRRLNQGQIVDFRFDEFEIDLGRHEVRRAGEVVAIEPQVFDVLVHLVRNHHRIVSKDELIDAVWQGRAISDAALSSRISAARRAIGDNGDEQRLIRTLHKRGFRFVGALDEIAFAAESPPLAASVDEDAPVPDAAMAGGLAVGEHAEPSAQLVLVLPDKPSIAVLPFHNMSGAPEDDYFADGLTEDIITGLSRQRWFFVIARNSTFAYKGEAVDVRKVASELGVRYVLEGSVRKAGDRVRVTGQLIDVSNGLHLWADRFDREGADVFQLQDDITDKVIGSVGPEILAAEAARVRRTPPQSIDAWDLVMRALPHMWRVSADEQRKAQEFLSQAIALDPEYAHAHALLGWTYVSMFNYDTRTPIHAFTDKAIEAGATAVALDDQEPWGHLVLGLGHARRRRPEEAVTHLSKAIDLNPNFALAHAGLGYALACGGDPETGLWSLEQAERLSPRDPFLAIYAPSVRYMALFALERYEEALTVCRAVAALHPHHAGAWRLTTVCLGLLGRSEEAAAALAHTLTLQPDLAAAHVERDTVFADPDDRARFLQGLRAAGLEK